MGVVCASGPGRQRAHAQGPHHAESPRLRLHRVHERRGRRLRHQDHEHDQAIRQADPCQQGVRTSEKSRHWRQSIHRQPRLRGRREAPL